MSIVIVSPENHSDDIQDKNLEVTIILCMMKEHNEGRNKY